MYLKETEQILKIYRHHPTPFVIDILKTILAFIPFFVIIYFLKDSVTTMTFFLLNLIAFFIFVFVLIYKAIVYWMDKLIITNARLIYVDWKYLTTRNEHEAYLDDIQDIVTKEKGFLSNFWIFDYGDFRLQTASSKSIIHFDQAPDPEGIRQFVYSLKPTIK